MDLESTVADATLVQEVVLLGVAWHATRGETPVRSDEVRVTCNERFDEVTGRLSAGDVSRALNALAGTDVLAEDRPDDSSPVGKGRPAYELAVGPDAMLEVLADEEPIEPLVADVR